MEGVGGPTCGQGGEREDEMDEIDEGSGEDCLYSENESMN